MLEKPNVIGVPRPAIVSDPIGVSFISKFSEHFLSLGRQLRPFREMAVPLGQLIFILAVTDSCTLR